MKKILSLMLVASLFIFTSCNTKTEDSITSDREVAPSSDPALGYPTLFTEQELMAHLTSIEEAIDHYYRLTSVPVDMEFMRYTYRPSYIDWYYRIPSNNSYEIGLDGYIYLRWFLGDGQTWLDNDQNALAMGRTEIKVGERTLEYYVGDTVNPKLYGIRWLQDGYLFEISIPEEYIVKNGEIDESLLLKYTDLSKVIIVA